MTVAEKLTILIARHRLTVSGLAAMVDGVSRSTVDNWFKGRTLPGLKEALQLSRIFGVPLEYLADDSEDAPQNAPELTPDEQAILDLYRALRLSREEAMRGLAYVARDPKEVATQPAQEASEAWVRRRAGASKAAEILRRRRIVHSEGCPGAAGLSGEVDSSGEIKRVTFGNRGSRLPGAVVVFSAESGDVFKQGIYYFVALNSDPASRSPAHSYPDDLWPSPIDQLDVSGYGTWSMPSYQSALAALKRLFPEAKGYDVKLGAGSGPVFRVPEGDSMRVQFRGSPDLFLPGPGTYLFCFHHPYRDVQAPAQPASWEADERDDVSRMRVARALVGSPSDN